MILITVENTPYPETMRKRPLATLLNHTESLKEFIREDETRSSYILILLNCKSPLSHSLFPPSRTVEIKHGMTSTEERVCALVCALSVDFLDVLQTYYSTYYADSEWDTNGDGWLLLTNIKKC
ncbi:hypothetical protein WA026_009519 [Henosepilachna vigintioctopunctata]|uniref:Uncharacterized protein n=1 Tax=Henosepilachna vigintioctopunctata TaxID=420089 RepID=A0AAW1U548_9CUCU